MDSGEHERHDIRFPSEGVQITGWLYLPTEPPSEPAPAVVVSHGFAYVKEIFADHDYPDAFAAAGFVVLVFDHPCTGASEGLPRQELDPIRQQRAYRDAITYLAQRPEVDPDRIGIWGTSYSGGHVLAVGASDRRVRCVVSQAMTISGHTNLRDRYTPPQLDDLRAQWAEDRLARFRGEEPLLVPAGSDETIAFLADVDPKLLERYRPLATARTYELYDEYEPAAFIERISPTPLLMIVCTEDQRTPAHEALSAYERALEPKRLLVLRGDHYSVYRTHFRESSEAAVNWFVEHLGGRLP